MIQQTSVLYPSIKSKLHTVEKNNYLLSIEPLLPGYGHTLGNSLRRILLSSVPGYAVTRIRINDITHEYQSIDGVVEDAMNVILNLKSLQTVIKTDEDVVTISLNKLKKGDVLASDFVTKGKVDIVNPDLYICHLSKDIGLNIEVEIRKGFGYLSTDKIDFSGNLNPQDILVDALFSPVTNAALKVEKIRVGESTDFDKLEIAFATNGSQSGQDIVDFVLNFINDLFKQIQSGVQSSTKNLDTEMKPEKQVEDVVLSSDINLESEILAILEKNGILTNDQLKSKVDELDDFSGMTKKRIEKIKNYIETL
jgi:DNA-directed RNA polymerase subunit alpha